VQFVYIDEAQDLVMAQLAVLTLLCKDTASGLVVAGDTAQTITKGVAFRFADVGTLVHRLHYGLLGEEQGGHTSGPVLTSDPSQQQQPGPTRTRSASSSAQPTGASMDKQQPLERAASAPAAAAAAATPNEPVQAKVPKRAAKLVESFRGKCRQHAAASLIKQTQPHPAVVEPGTSSSSSSSRHARKTVSWQHQHQQQQRQGLGATGPGSTDLRLSNAAVDAPDANSVSTGRDAKLPSVIDQLTLRQNWRTQAAVLAVANAITDVLYQLFPNTVDKLPAETSTVKGVVPVMLDHGPSSDPLLMVFGTSSGAAASVPSGSSRDGRRVSGGDLNARTAVLVRDDGTAAAVRQLVRDGALVLTVAEAKGLEFEVRAMLWCSMIASKQQLWPEPPVGLCPQPVLHPRQERDAGVGLRRPCLACELCML
jgi:hypothetical protein